MGIGGGRIVPVYTLVQQHLDWTLKESEMTANRTEGGTLAGKEKWQLPAHSDN